jgi:hypothetical protein
MEVKESKINSFNYEADEAQAKQSSHASLVASGGCRVGYWMVPLLGGVKKRICQS